jgi:hypothetical protein
MQFEVNATLTKGNKAMNRKKIFFILFLMAAMIMVASSVSAAEKINTDPKQQLPDPDTKPATIDKPVKVFILMGQSNMLGFGKVGPEEKNGTLEYLTKKKGKYAHLVDEKFSWIKIQLGLLTYRGGPRAKSTSLPMMNAIALLRPPGNTTARMDFDGTC